MRYDTLLFDADDTLLDFRAAERDALFRLFAAHGLQMTDELHTAYSGYNQSLWRRLERGELTREQLLQTRFSGFFAQIGAKLDGSLAEEEYRGYLAENASLIPGAREVCTELAKRHCLCVITNGISNTQRARMKLSGIEPLFRHVFISQDIGYAKPDLRFFSAVFHALPGAKPEKTLIIGDSLSSDILGGIRAGVDTCWFCPGGLPEKPEIEPTWRITDLTQLLPIADQK